MCGVFLCAQENWSPSQRSESKRRSRARREADVTKSSTSTSNSVFGLRPRNRKQCELMDGLPGSNHCASVVPYHQLISGFNIDNCGLIVGEIEPDAGKKIVERVAQFGG